jgi:starch phosphorylase
MNKRTARKPRHAEHERIRIGLNHKAIAQAFLDSLYFIQGRTQSLATRNNLYMALAYAVRDRLFSLWLMDARALKNNLRADIKFVGYLSAEFLPGPHLGNNLINLGIYEETRKALHGLGYDLEKLLKQE